MNQHLKKVYAGISVAVSLTMGLCRVQAQASRDSSWQKEAETRLQAIYTHGEFRPQKFQPEWLSDSSGYTIEEQSPTADKTIRSSYDVRTGTHRSERWGGQAIRARTVVFARRKERAGV
jgi:hypothetical protein